MAAGPGAQRLRLRLAEIRGLLAVRNTGACPFESAAGLLVRHGFDGVPHRGLPRRLIRLAL